jgi:hypothetical protein
MLLQAVDDDLTRSVQDEAKLIMAINSAYMSKECLQEFEQKIASLSASCFPQDAPILECLPKPMSESIEAYKSIVENEIDDILNARGGVNQRLHQKVFETFANLNTKYAQMDLQQLEQFEHLYSGINPFFQHLVLKDILNDPILLRYEKNLCKFPFEKLILKLITNLIEWIEEKVKVLQFNELGALQLEKEISFLLQKLLELLPQQTISTGSDPNDAMEALSSDGGVGNASGQVRSEFTRLFQVVLILNLVDPVHVLEYESIKQELSIPEIEQILRLRIEFNDVDVTKVVQKLMMSAAEAIDASCAFSPTPPAPVRNA